MWGPYSRNPYSREAILYQFHTQILRATAKLVAGFTATWITLMTLSATFVATPRFVRRNIYKVILGTVKYSSKMVKQTGKILKGTVIFIAPLTMVKSFLRTLSATVKLEGSLIKQMYLTLVATVKLKTSRMRARYRYGFEFTGNFPDGSEIIIDRETWTVTRDGGNALHLIEGDLPFFTSGNNTLTYSDSEGARTVAIKVIYRGRWL